MEWEKIRVNIQNIQETHTTQEHERSNLIFKWQKP